jgi:hypothetical protein
MKYFAPTFLVLLCTFHANRGLAVEETFPADNGLSEAAQRDVATTFAN